MKMVIPFSFSFDIGLDSLEQDVEVVKQMGLNVRNEVNGGKDA